MGRWSIEELAAHMDEGVIQRLDHYVYRLIDPRNGETFYVGVGNGKRVLDHVRGVLDAHRTTDADGNDEVDLKLNRISQIRKSGFEVAHIIHRYRISDAKTARIVEAALIDAYPGLSNRVGGHGSSDYGCRHVEQIITEAGLPEFVPGAGSRGMIFMS